MALSGNKGEWSELYALFKLLADGKLFSGDGYLSRYDDKFYPILKIYRDDAPDRIEYKVNEPNIRISDCNNNLIIELPQNIFHDKTEELFSFIRAFATTTATNEALEPFLNQLRINKLTAKSQDKADIRIVIHNINTGSRPEMGYSIKSQLGGASSLLNACGDSTNFVYRITGINDNDMDEVNSKKKFEDKFNILSSKGAVVEFVRPASDTLYNNLRILDTSLPEIVALCLLNYYSHKGKTLLEVTDILNQEDPLHLLAGNQMPMYEFKIKQFLLTFALGMTPAKARDCKYNANGGYIVVKEDGDIVCYHFIDRNDLEDYLFYNTRFETPSQSRHRFGQIYKEGGHYYIKLNMQVRFKQ